MHGAPSVSHPVGRSSWAAGIVATAWTLAAGSTAAWILQGASGGRAALAIGLLAALGALAAWRWWRAPQGLLAWDGERWTWTPAGTVQSRGGSLALVLDLQRVLLVRWRDPVEGHWFWLQPQESPSRWDAMRRAVYSRAVAGSPSGAQPPSATP